MAATSKRKKQKASLHKVKPAGAVLLEEKTVKANPVKPVPHYGRKVKPNLDDKGKRIKAAPPGCCLSPKAGSNKAIVAKDHSSFRINSKLSVHKMAGVADRRGVNNQEVREKEHPNEKPEVVLVEGTLRKADAVGITRQNPDRFEKRKAKKVPSGNAVRRKAARLAARSKKSS